MNFLQWVSIQRANRLQMPRLVYNGIHACSALVIEDEFMCRLTFVALEHLQYLLEDNFSISKIYKSIKRSLEPFLTHIHTIQVKLQYFQGLEAWEPSPRPRWPSEDHRLWVCKGVDNHLLYLYTCILVYLYTCVPVYLYTCIFVYLYICILVYLNTCILVH